MVRRWLDYARTFAPERVPSAPRVCARCGVICNAANLPSGPLAPAGARLVGPDLMQATLHSIREAYERWAPTYAPVPHNPLMSAEQQAMLAQWPELVGRRAL